MFNPFDRTPTCDGRMDGLVDRHSTIAVAYTVLAWHLVVKIVQYMDIGRTIDSFAQ